jgi:hypothetical protein
MRGDVMKRPNDWNVEIPQSICIIPRLLHLRYDDTPNT